MTRPLALLALALLAACAEPAPAAPRPASIPDGWVAWEELGDACRLWRPYDLSAVRAEWGACPAGGPAGCERLGVSIPGDPADAITLDLDVDPEGVGDGDRGAFLAFSQIRTGGGRTWQDLIAVDDAGRVRALLRKDGAWGAGCWILGEDLTAEGWLLRIKGDGEEDVRWAERERLARVDLSTGVPQRLPVEETSPASWSAWTVPGGTLIDQSPGHRLLFNPHGSAALIPAWDPETDPAGRELAGPPARGPDGALLALVSRSGGALARLSPQGQITLIHEAAPGEAAWNLGTDGLQVAWSEGALADGPRRARSAPWPREGSALAPVELGEDPSRRGIDPFAVGCGVAIHADADPRAKVILGGGAPAPLPGGPGWRRGKPLVIACGAAWLRLLAPEPALVRVALPTALP